jgi:hypothetical protein
MVRDVQNAASDPLAGTGGILRNRRERGGGDIEVVRA